MRHIMINIISVVKGVHMAKPQPGNPKEKFLRESGALNTHPVNDSLFKDGHFFDPQDLVQVKYEMIRKVTKESEPVSQAEKLGLHAPWSLETLLVWVGGTALAVVVLVYVVRFLADVVRGGNP